MTDNSEKQVLGKDLIIKVLMIVIGAYLSVALTADYFGSKSTKSEIAGMRSDFKEFKDKDFKELVNNVSALNEKRESTEIRFQEIGKDLNGYESRITKLEATVNP